jgi:hypothetical protein
LTVNNVLVVLKAMIRVAVELGTLKASPCRIPLLDVPKREMAFYTQEEFERVLAATTSAEERLAVLGTRSGRGWPSAVHQSNRFKSSRATQT